MVSSEKKRGPGQNGGVGKGQWGPVLSLGDGVPGVRSAGSGISGEARASAMGGPVNGEQLGPVNNNAAHRWMVRPRAGRRGS
jgi:hypothetical protein